MKNLKNFKYLATLLCEHEFDEYERSAREIPKFRPKFVGEFM